MTIHTTLEGLYKSKPVIAAQIGLPLLVALGTNYLTGASMYQGLASGIAIAAISGIDPRGNESNEWFCGHEGIQAMFANPFRHTLTSTIFYSAIQHTGISHHSTMLLAKCCSTLLFSSHNESQHSDAFSYISLSNIACEALTSYVIQSTLGDDYYFTQFLANFIGRTLVTAYVLLHRSELNKEDTDHKKKSNYLVICSGAIIMGFATSAIDTLVPITGTSPIIKCIPERLSSFASSVINKASESVAATIGL